jgi:hypothetical protein
MIKINIHPNPKTGRDIPSLRVALIDILFLVRSRLRGSAGTSSIRRATTECLNIMRFGNEKRGGCRGRAAEKHLRRVSLLP